MVGSLVAVSAVLSADALAANPWEANWKDNKIYFDCNGVNCTLPVKSITTAANAKLEAAKAEGYKFNGWNIETYQYHRWNPCVHDCDDKCEIMHYSDNIPALSNMPTELTSSRWSSFKKDHCKNLKLGGMLRVDREYKHPGDNKLASAVEGTFKAHAQWKMINYNVKVYFNGGYVDNSTTASTKSVGQPDWSTNYTIKDKGTAKTQFPKPQKNGYTFKGWCNNQQMTYCVDNPDLYDETPNKVYYAKWEPKATYKITLMTNGGKVGGKDWEQINSDVYQKIYTNIDNFTLPTAFRGGTMMFDGWCTDKELKKCSKTVTIANGTSNKTYYAKYKQVDLNSTIGKTNLNNKVLQKIKVEQ